LYVSQVQRALFAVVCWACAQASFADDQLRFTRDGETQYIRGRQITEARDGGRLLLADDGRLWAVQPDEIQDFRRTEAPFTPLDRDALRTKLTAELPTGFRTRDTAHFLIVYNTSDVYAQWCGSLYERLYVAFYNYFERRGAELHEPDQPLIAVIFSRREDFKKYASAKLGESAGSVIGYYDLETNYMVMCDLTGADAATRGAGVSTAAQINRLLSTPGAGRNVATIIHEATHQIAFNSGLMHRWSDVPLWLSEGVAMFFETPDLGRMQGWRTVGAVNHSRLANLKPRLARWDALTFAKLLADNARFADAETALPAYAESWATVFTLLKQRPEDFVKYTQQTCTGPPLKDIGPTDRLRAFQSAFGSVSGTHRDVVQTMGRLR
jgi:hypothetical protein